MRLERAIFTSHEALTGRGYRIVAASGGITAVEKQAISVMSPSHESLCGADEHASGMAFYPIRNGRLGLALSRCAGWEQSGRGGHRVLTHVFLVDADAFVKFGSNPLAIRRAIERTAGALDYDPGCSKLDPLELPRGDDEHATAVDDRLACDARGGMRGSRFLSPPLDDTMSPSGRDDALILISDETRAIAAGYAALGDRAAEFVLSTAMGDGCLVLVGADQECAIIEALMLSMPAVLRARCGFTIGLRFALNRRQRLHFVDEGDRHLERAVRGQAIDLVDSRNPAPLPDRRTTWTDMAADCRRTNRVDDLRALAQFPFEDVVPDTLNRAAESQIALNHLAERTTDEIIDRVAEPPSESDVAVDRWLDARIWTRAFRVLSTRLDSASADQLPGALFRLSNVPDRPPELADLCRRLAERVESAAAPV